MLSTQNPTCPLCGLRYTERPLLELHIREDHMPRGGRAGSGRGDSGPAQIPRPRPEAGTVAGALADAEPLADAASATAVERPRPPRSGRTMTALRRLARTARHVHLEMARASELAFPQPLPRDDPRRDRGRAASGAERVDQAA